MPVGVASGLPARFLLLDVARALAALAVLFWHYQHFSYPLGATTLGEGSMARPFGSVFGLLYDHGRHAVPFFWIISGLVFARVYLVGQASTTRRFFANRFGRLYPLHIATLLAVVLLQWVATRQFGTQLIYEQNDGYHFALNLLLASAWGLEQGYSFNAPIWSVSVEIVIYALFWMLQYPLRRCGPRFALVLTLAFLACLMLAPADLILRCGFYFFLGVSLLWLYQAVYRRRGVLMTVGVVLAGAGAAGLLAGMSPFWQFYALSAMFSGAVLLLLALDCYVPARMQRACNAIGDLTYGMYLWHFPLQLLAIIVFGAAIRDVAENPIFLIIYITAVIAMARLGFITIERPLHRRIRSLAEQGRCAARPARVLAGGVVALGGDKVDKPR